MALYMPALRASIVLVVTRLFVRIGELVISTEAPVPRLCRLM
jgi:hypothetical protein